MRVQRIRRGSVLQGWFDDTRPGSQYPQTYTGFPSDMDDWSCDQFKIYYQRNKAIIGKTAALEFIQNEASRLSAWSNIYNWCKYDCSFVDYFKAEGLDVGNIFSNTYCAGSSVVDAVASTTGAISNTAGFVSDLTSNKFVMTAVVLGLGYYAYTKFK